MTAKEFRIKCPHCARIVVVDARTGKIIRHFEQSKDDDEAPDPALFDDALGKVKKNQDEGETVLDDAFKKFKDRKKGLEGRFRDAKKKADEKGDDPKDRPDFWD